MAVFLLPLYLKQEPAKRFIHIMKDRIIHEGAMPESTYPTRLPSQHQIGENVWLQLWSDYIVSEINAVHFYESKVKYDLIVNTSDGGQTRLYNVDSDFITKTKQSI